MSAQLNYMGWVISHAPARPTEHQYIATRFGRALYASSPIALLALVNNAVANYTPGGCYA